MARTPSTRAMGFRWQTRNTPGQSPTEVYGHRENVRPTAGPNGARRIPFGIAPQNPHFDLRQLPMVRDVPPGMWEEIDFVECLRRGIDAVELCWYGEEYQDQRADDLYLALYGWDCDSIVVLNPDAVIQI